MPLPTCARLAALALLVSLAARAEPAPAAATEPIPPLLRVGAETGGGIVGGLILGGASAWVIYATLNTQGDDAARRSAAQVGAAVGVSVGAPIGVSLTGKLLGHQGSFIISWLSSLAGLGVGYGIYGLIRSGSDSSAAKATYALTLLLPIAGAVIGYELSSSDQPPSPAASAPTLLPALAVGPAGASFGLVGRF
ncbi:MAG TPA: hypothetical protein VFD38_20500 [Myxococcaceae bacterium]|nr:hypothetical protein [Myxococcaceae bacterium]